MYPMMTRLSFSTRALSLSVALKGHLLGHALSSFQRSLSLQPNPDLDAPDSFQLPSADSLSSQGNGDFTSSHSLCQARQSLMRPATYRCLRRRLLTVASSSQTRGALDASVKTPLPVLSKLTAPDLADETAALSHVSPEREAARQTRSL